MAWVSQELKKQVSPGIKAVLKKYGVKGTISVRDNRTLVVSIKAGPINFIGDYTGRFPSDHFLLNGYPGIFVGKSGAFLSELFDAMDNGNWDESDIMTDHFNVGWYTDIKIGNVCMPFMAIWNWALF